MTETWDITGDEVISLILEVLILLSLKRLADFLFGVDLIEERIDSGLSVADD